MLKYTKANLSRLEDLVSEGGYMVRYERGNFKSGYCILKENRMILINNFLPLEGRINCMYELAKTLPLHESGMSPRSLKLLHEIRTPDLFEIPFEKESGNA